MVPLDNHRMDGWLLGTDYYNLPEGKKYYLE
jgi:hypothetical protein